MLEQQLILNHQWQHGSRHLRVVLWLQSTQEWKQQTTHGINIQWTKSINQKYFIQQHQGSSNFVIHHFQSLSHNELLWAHFYLFRNNITFITITHYTHQTRPFFIFGSAASLQDKLNYDLYIFEPSMTKWLSTQSRTHINFASNQLQVISILEYFHTTFETSSNLTKATDMILLRSDGTHSRGHTRAEWEYCV